MHGAELDVLGGVGQIVPGDADAYANWDNVDDREWLLVGPARLVEQLGWNRLSGTTPVAPFDELHKYRRAIRRLMKSFSNGATAMLWSRFNLLNCNDLNHTNPAHVRAELAELS